MALYLFWRLSRCTWVLKVLENGHTRYCRIPPGVTHSDNHHRWYGTVVKPQQPPHIIQPRKHQSMRSAIFCSSIDSVFNDRWRSLNILYLINSSYIGDSSNKWVYSIVQARMGSVYPFFPAMEAIVSSHESVLIWTVYHMKSLDNIFTPRPLVRKSVSHYSWPTAERITTPSFLPRMLPLPFQLWIFPPEVSKVSWMSPPLQVAGDGQRCRQWDS